MLDAQIWSFRLQRAVLRATGRTTEPEGLNRMTELTSLTSEERHRTLDEYLDAVFGDEAEPEQVDLRTE